MPDSDPKAEKQKSRTYRSLLGSHGAGPNFACSVNKFIEAPLSVKQKVQIDIFHGNTLTSEGDSLRELSPANKPSIDAVGPGPMLPRASRTSQTNRPGPLR